MYALASFGAVWVPGLAACILRGRRGTSGSTRGLMYALASFGAVWAPGLSAWNLPGRRGNWCPGVVCFGSGALCLEFGGRRGTW